MNHYNTKEKLLEGKSIYGLILPPKISESSIIKSIKEAGFEYVFIDLEHTPYSIESIETTICVCRKYNLDPWIRIPGIYQHYIGRTLDLGATGLIIPRVEQASQVEEIIKYSKFPPEGKRGFGGGRFRGFLPEGSIQEHCEWSNSNISIIVQFETKEALANIDEIFSVKGITGVLIGPCDLSISLGVPGEFNHPKVIETCRIILEKASSRNIPAGIVDSFQSSKNWQKEGMQIFCFATLELMILNEGKRLLKLFRNDK